MFFQKKLITIKESKDKSLANFFIAYHSDYTKQDNKQKSFELISLLKGQNEVILEIDSQLTAFPTPERTGDAMANLLDDLKAMEVDYRDQLSEVKGKGIFGIILTNKTFTAHRILAEISNKRWHEEEFRNFLPGYGVRYYICKANTEAKKILEDLHAGKIKAGEQLDFFDFIIYDCSEFGQMGIQTKLSKAELQERLKI